MNDKSLHFCSFFLQLFEPGVEFLHFYSNFGVIAANRPLATPKTCTFAGIPLF
jgi:hypothetical protein